MPKVSLIEIFLLQTIFYAILWLVNEYVASYLCLILPIVAAVVLLISWIADLIEPARIGMKYYYVMAITVITPLLVGGCFYLIYDGNLAWLRDELSR
jgi:hypothetical protein